MYAIIATGGKQYKVAEGDVIRVEKLGVEAGQTYNFDQVLAVNNGEMIIGTPTVAGATVSATVMGEGRAKKVIVLHLRREERHYFAAPLSAFSFYRYPCLLPAHAG